MADEIAQACQLELEGIKMVVKGSVSVAQFIFRALKAFVEAEKTKHEERHEKRHEKRLNRAGEKTFKQMLELCEGNPPQALSVRETDFDEVMRQAEEQGLHYHMAVDFIPNDGMVPIIIPPQEAALWGQIYKAVASRRLEEDKKVVNIYDKLINEEKEKLLNEKDPEKKKKIETKIENLEQAKQEAAKWVDYDEEVIKKDDPTISLQEYLMQSKGTDFEKSPEVAMAEHVEGVEIGQSISAKECFQPIRDKSLMPESKLMFYLPEQGAIVTREFHLDKETNLVYSEYSLKTEKGEILTFTDKDTTKELWNQKTLPQLLDGAGILEGTQCRAFDDSEKLERFMKYHDKIASPSEKKVKKALEEGKEVFSKAEAKDEIIDFVSENEKGLASAPTTGNTVEIICNPAELTREKGKLHYKLSDDESIVFSHVFDENLAPNAMVKFSINDQSGAVFVKKTDGAITAISISPDTVLGKIKESKGEGIAEMASAIKSTVKR